VGTHHNGPTEEASRAKGRGPKSRWTYPGNTFIDCACERQKRRGWAGERGASEAQALNCRPAPAWVQQTTERVPGTDPVAKRQRPSHFPAKTTEPTCPSFPLTETSPKQTPVWEWGEFGVILKREYRGKGNYVG